MNRRALVLVVAGVVLAVAITASFGEEETRPVQALLLVVPIVAVAVAFGRRAAYGAAVVDGIVFALLVPPVGSFRVRLAEDVGALAVFFVVALVVGSLVAGRIELLGRVERQRAALLRSVSHDLRTPLASIQAAASELASDVEHPPATQHALLAAIEGEAERLDRLVGNLLSLGRREAGAFEPKRQPVEVAEVVEAVAARLERLFRPLHLEVELVEPLPVLSADHLQLDQLLTNLLENAARHSPPGGTVHLTARPSGTGVQLVVRDQGPGVPPEERDVIFQPFRSGAVAGSSGVGLAICAAVAEGHGGTIHVRDAAGGGAEFTVDLPG